MGESEKHSHRTDEEWRAMLRDWISRLQRIELDSAEAYLGRGFNEVIDEMESVSK